MTALFSQLKLLNSVRGRQNKIIRLSIWVCLHQQTLLPTNIDNYQPGAAQILAQILPAIFII